MDARLRLSSDSLTADEIQNMTRALNNTLNRETDIGAALSEQAAGPGTRGAEIEFGTIALSFLSSGAAVALFNVLKSYFERKTHH